MAKKARLSACPSDTRLGRADGPKALDLRRDLLQSDYADQQTHLALLLFAELPDQRRRRLDQPLHLGAVDVEGVGDARASLEVAAAELAQRGGDRRPVCRLPGG